MRVWIALRYRKIRYGYAFRRIPLTRGKYAIVDPERYSELAKDKWHVSWSENGLYAVRKFWTKEGGRFKQKYVSIHRVIIGAGEREVVDHINHNSLDNRLANLRLATVQQNAWNARKRKCNCSSKYKGVSWSKIRKKWRARITFNGRLIFIGYFDREKAAAMAYDAKARELFGDYASLNMPSCSTFTKRQKKQLNCKKTAD